MSSAPQLLLHGTEISPPVRAVRLTLAALGLDYEYREMNVLTGDQLRPEFVAKNPQHTVPLLEDGDNVVWDSHAICAYLARKYAPNDQLYPKDFLARAVVDQRLHYDTGVLFHTCLKQISRPLLYEGARELPPQRIEQIHDAYAMLETFLEGRTYLAGDKLTIADLCTVATVSSFHAGVAPLDAAQYPRLYTWLTRLSQLPYYEVANGRGAVAYGELIKSKLPRNFDQLWRKAAADALAAKQ